MPGTCFFLSLCILCMTVSGNLHRVPVRSSRRPATSDEAAFEAVLKPPPMSNIVAMRDEIIDTFRGNSGDISRYVEEALMEQMAPNFVVPQGVQTHP
ncbi:hypothetical protein PCE1_003308 [Barthelona sp. PCE]